MPRLLGLLLALPILEIVAFALVASAIGVGKAILLQLAISAIGVAMIGSIVKEAKARARAEGGFLSVALDGSMGMRGLAGLLFAIPGFLTDALGVLALVPSVRSKLRRLLGVGERPRATAAGAARGPVRPAQDGLIELDQREWREVEPVLRPDR